VEDKAVDQAYLRAHPEHLPTFLTHQRIRETPVGGGPLSVVSRLTLDDGTSVCAKSWRVGEPPAGFFAAESAGLRWLRETATVPVPEVITDLPALLATEWIEPGTPSRAAAERFGRDLAALHRTDAGSFGADWPGFIGPLPLDNTLTSGPWGPWFAERRLRPYLKISADSGALTATDVGVIDQIIKNLSGYGESERPTRTHGDLWHGNLLWGTDGRGWLIDPAAHGGHRETDLANLALFGGVAHLGTILGAYQEVYPLAEGWTARVPLHQLHLLLVHTAAFGGTYRSAVRIAAESALRA
jgi:fructosamine-3-kinase